MSNNNADREVILSISHVDISFDVGGKKKFVAVKDANFDIYKGETFALVGESGSGKTTLGRAIMRINPCSNGEILFEGKRISGKISREEDRNVVRNIQMIFQDPAASLNERATIEYCISEGLYNFHLYKDEEERIAKVDQALKDVGLLPEHKSRYPHEFSGGQRQRVGIARAMIMDPKLIVADEPISALDVSIRAQVLNLMNKRTTFRSSGSLPTASPSSISARLWRSRIPRHCSSARCIRTPSPCSPPCRCPTRSLNGLAAPSCTTPPSWTSPARCAPCARSAPGTSSLPRTKRWKATRRSSPRSRTQRISKRRRR